MEWRPGSAVLTNAPNPAITKFMQRKAPKALTKPLTANHYTEDVTIMAYPYETISKTVVMCAAL